MFKSPGRMIAAIAALAAAGAPASAYAMPAPAAGGPAPDVIALPAPTSVASAPQGFSWNDAGIGAAATVGLLGAASAGAVLLLRRQPQH